MTGKIAVTTSLENPAKELLEKSKADIIIITPEGRNPTPQELVKAVKNVDVLLTDAGVPIPAKVVQSNPDLLGIANFGVGFNNIDVETATELGIPVTNTPGVVTESTADIAWSLLMAAARRLPEAHNCVATGKWEYLMGLDIGPGASNTKKVLGIIGFGRIGLAMMQRSRGFKMKVIAFDPPLKKVIEQTRGVEYRKLDELLKESGSRQRGPRSCG